jgi:hypothetical protein
VGFKHLACFLLVSLAFGQAAQPPTTAGANAGGSFSAAAGKTSAAQVAPDDPVITVNGLCAQPAQPGSTCQTVITRAQFEKLAEALQPDMPPALRLKVANAYARNMRMAAAAEKRGLDRTAAFEEEMRYARMQLLSQDLDRALRAEANNISDADVAGYYEKNKSSFEQATVARIFVPHAKQIAPGAPEKANDEARGKAAADAMTRVAADLRSRAVNGEDPDKLQIAAYAEAGIERSTADTKLEKVRRATLPMQHESVMDLKPGEVSEVFSDPAGAHFIYKMLSKETLTLEEAEAEIRAAISTQRYRDSIKPFQGDVVFSDAYFNPPGQSTAPVQRNPKERRKEPPTEQ